MATVKKRRTVPKKIEEKPASEIVPAETAGAKKIAVKKPGMAKAATKKISTPKSAVKNAGIPKVHAEAVPAKKTGGIFARAIHGTLFAAGRLILKTKNLKRIHRTVKWDSLSAGAKTVLDSTKQEIGKIGGNIKSAVSAEKIAVFAQKTLSKKMRAG